MGVSSSMELTYPNIVGVVGVCHFSGMEVLQLGSSPNSVLLEFYGGFHIGMIDY